MNVKTKLPVLAYTIPIVKVTGVGVGAGLPWLSYRF